ncbi:V-type ATP synthase subunit I [Streptococcus merionis]|uniref:V-type H+-transporting ATPase subunit I n=1 Tax=Streptococcus merionis TaxID=400065 RepID=A0A239SPE6_9STRE|nr:V-type ATP synthase subunit I [Streptococcus merionis]SNU87277.1 V-type H+-transporting ATPase subunit I [Streptococcus merionis]
MAISQMQKLSLILPKEQLDDVLLVMQDLRHVEVRDLGQDASWQLALSENQVQLAEVSSFDRGGQEVLAGEEALAYFLKRQQKLENAIAQLKTYLPKQGLIASLRQKRRLLDFSDVEIQGRECLEENVLKKVQSLFREHDSLKEQLQKLEDNRTQISKWSNLEITPKELSKFKHIKALVGTIPNTEDNQFLRQLQEAEAVDFQEVFRSETEYGVILFLHPREEKKAPINFEDFLFKPLEYPYDLVPAEQLKEFDVAEKLLLERIQGIEGQLRDAQDSLEQLELELEAVTNHHARELAKKKLAASQYLVAIEGWIETSELPLFKQKLQAEYGDSILLTESEVTEEDWDYVPTQLRNHPLIEPFEMITEMYSLPKYYEKDPTPYVAPFYFTFFGMMIADVGYGLLLFLATGLALRFFSLAKGTKRFLQFFNVLSVSVSLWGLVYGSFFAFELPVQLLSTTDDVMVILVLSVAFGFITVLTALFLSGRQKMRMKDYAEAYNAGFAWLLILVGVIFLIVGMMLPSMAYLATIGKWLMILNAIGILVVSVIASKSLAGLGSGLYNLYNATGYVSDLVSFTRLMALGVSGASIGTAFNMIVGLLPTPARFTVGILLFIALHAVNLALSLLSGYVHGARLIFVEFFGKFYEGGGRAFNPLRPAEKYFDIKKVHLEDK